MHDIVRRFWSKVQKTDTCWLWTASRLYEGYGRISYRGKVRLAHRVAWELTHGEIAPGLVVMHTCDNPACVNPDHLRIGTQAENLAQRDRRGRLVPWNRNKTHCKLGHELEVVTPPDEPRRICRECARVRTREALRRMRARRRAEAA